VAFANFSPAQTILDFLRQFQATNDVGNRGAVFADLFGNFFLG